MAMQRGHRQLAIGKSEPAGLRRRCLGQHNAAMKNLIRMAVLSLALTVLGGCANQPDKATPKTLNVNCVISGEKADGPTVDYMNGKLAFCCKDCMAKWNAMDEATKKKTFDTAMAKK